jgi:glycosyl transferase, family 25
MALPIVFINLASDVDRRERMEGEFRRLRLSYDRLDAVRWTLLTAEQQDSFYSKTLNHLQYHSPLVAGEKGCYASHLVAWKMLLEGTAAAMVVLEDDVKLVDEFAEVIDAIERLDVPWDMVKLIGREHEKIRSKKPLVKNFDLIEYRRVPSLTAGYVVSRKGAEKLLQTRRPFGRPIDVDLRFWWENQLTILGVTPAVLVLDETSFTSSIGLKSQKRSLAQQWKKFRLKCGMTVQNFSHLWRQAKKLH